VRQAKPETLIVADGFSCREQILQATGRQAIHLAEAIYVAMRAADSSTGQRAPAGVQGSASSTTTGW
jgi:hypothetical protein